MNIYLIERTDIMRDQYKEDYDTYDSFIMYASGFDDAIKLAQSFVDSDDNIGRDAEWLNSYKFTIKYIGHIEYEIEPAVLLASFNAG
jgi:hypothetical protein